MCSVPEIHSRLSMPVCEILMRLKQGMKTFLEKQIKLLVFIY